MKKFNLDLDKLTEAVTKTVKLAEQNRIAKELLKEDLPLEVLKKLQKIIYQE